MSDLVQPVSNMDTATNASSASLHESPIEMEITEQPLTGSPGARPVTPKSRRSTGKSVAKSTRTPIVTQPSLDVIADQLREVLFDRATSIAIFDVPGSELTSHFNNAALFSIVVILGGAALLYFTRHSAIGSVMDYALGSHGALLSISYALLAIIGFAQYKVFQWLRVKTGQSVKNRMWDLSSEFLQTREGSKNNLEQASWLNGLLSSIWPFLNPTIFQSISDILEGIIYQNSPTNLIRAVNIEHISQGSQAIRIVGLRQIYDEKPDGHDPTHPSMFGSSLYEHEAETESRSALETPSRPRRMLRSITTMSRRKESKDQDTGASSTAEAAMANVNEKVRLLQERTTIHVEAAFEFGGHHREHNPEISDPEKPHVALSFYLPGGVKFPVWVELRKVIGAMRARVQLKPDPPFVTDATVSLMGAPELQFACMPMFRTNVNVMSMPLVSSIVQKALDAAMAAYIAPNSLTFDLGAILAGDDTLKDTFKLGVFSFVIHQVHDIRTLSGETEIDSVVNISMMKFGESIHMTRAITCTASPRFEEAAWWETSPNDVNASESIELQLHRCKNMKRLETIGTTHLPLSIIMSAEQSSNKMWRRRDVLASPQGGAKVGTIEWSIGYFPKAHVTDSQIAAQTVIPGVNNMSELEAHVHAQTESKLSALPPSLHASFEKEKVAALKEAEILINSHSTPSEDLPSGLLYGFVHQLMFLSTSKYFQTTKGRNGPVIDMDDDESDAPYSYASSYINGECVSQTRIKPKEDNPYFGDNWEEFIRDWRQTEVVVSVRDRRQTRTDLLIGGVKIDLRQLFTEKKAGYVQLLYPLEGGEGAGLLKLSLLFRPVELHLPTQRLGWSIGTLKTLLPIVACDDSLHDLRRYDMIVKLGAGRQKLQPFSSPAIIGTGSKRIGWRLKDHDAQTADFAVVNKYTETLIIEFHADGVKRALAGDKVYAFAFLRIADLLEGQKEMLKLGVYESKEKDVIESDLPWDENEQKAMGYIAVGVEFFRGLTDAHERVSDNVDDVDDVLDLYDGLKEAAGEHGTEKVGWRERRRRQREKARAESSVS